MASSHFLDHKRSQVNGKTDYSPLMCGLLGFGDGFPVICAVSAAVDKQLTLTS